MLREFKKATAQQLKAFQERDLSQYDVVSVCLDGKSFADDQMVLALGTTEPRRICRIGAARSSPSSQLRPG